GIVSIIDPSVQGDGTFRVLISPDPEEEVKWPDQNILRQGARAVGIVLLDEVSVGYELWRQINGFPKSMPDMSNQNPTEKKVKAK
ncbi:MAG: transporter, partial [Pseudomonadota bacterium]